MTEYKKFEEHVESLLSIVYGTIYMENNKEVKDDAVIKNLLEIEKNLKQLLVLYPKTAETNELITELQMVGNFIKDNLDKQS